MNKKRILCFGYRKWALSIYQALQDSAKFQIHISQKKEEVNSGFIGQFQPDFVLFYGWSWIIEKSIIDKFKCVMLHPSPLPKYRGGSPIQNQIINNEVDSAVTLFLMDHGLDSGGIISQQHLSLKGSLKDIFNRIEKIGVDSTLSFLIDGYTLTQQNDNEATYYKRRKPEESEITLDDLSNEDPQYIYNKIRMLADPYPNAYVKLRDGAKLYIKEADIVLSNDNLSTSIELSR